MDLFLIELVPDFLRSEDKPKTGINSEIKTTRNAYYYIISALVVLAVGFILIADKKHLARDKSADGLKNKVAERTLVISKKTIPPSEAKNVIRMDNMLGGENTLAEIPEQWEKPLMDILLNNKNTPEDRVRNLYEMATGSAQGVPRIQEECLNHLLYTIPDEQTNLFYNITTNSVIPIQLRESFLEKTLSMRPQELCVPLCEALRYNPNYAIANICQKYLQDISIYKNAEAGVGGY